jgi:hypothetical protein
MKRITLIVLAVAVAVAVAVAMAGCDKPQTLPSRSTAAAVERSSWQTPFGAGTLYSTAHYHIYSTVTRPALMAIAPGFMEAAHDYYSKLTGLDALPHEDAANQDPRAPIYLVATRRQWANLTSQLVKQNLQVYLCIDAGGFCYRDTCVFWDVGGLETLRLAAHEGLHQYFGRHNAHLPIWLEEGLCVCAEGFDLQGSDVVFEPERNLVRSSTLRSALARHQWIGIEQLVSMDGGDAVQDPRPGAAVEYYAQLWALTLYLQSQPETHAAVGRIIADCAARKVPPPQLTPQDRDAIARDPTGRMPGKILAKHIFRKYVSEDFDAFDKGYQAFATKLAGL